MAIGEVFELTKKNFAYTTSLDDGIRTLEWVYDWDKWAGEKRESMHVVNGKANIIKVGDLSAEEYAKRYPNTANLLGNTSNGGYWRIEEGTEVTIELVPDYGYQLAGAALNGIALEPQASRSTFTFTIPQAQLGFSAMFAKASDKINASATDVKTGSISGAANVVETGNVQLDVADLNISATEKAQFEQKLGEGRILKYLNLNLYNIVYKTADGSEVWSDKLEELNQEITVTLYLADNFAAQSGNYVIIREHKGAYEELPATYDASAKTLTFKTDKFSDYAIAVKPEDSSSSDDSSDEILVYADSNTAGQVIDSKKLDSFAGSITVNVPGATITRVSTDAAKKLIAEARKIAGASTFFVGIVDLHYTGTATFTLTCPGIQAGQDITILHMKSDGTFERIKPDKVEDGKVTFTMTSYSPIAIVANTGARSPKTGEIVLLVAAMALLFGAGAAACARKIRRK